MHAYIKRGAVALAAIGAVVGFVGSAHALTANCTENSVTYSLSEVATNTAAHVVCLPGNDTNTINSAFSLFGKTNWILASKTDELGAGDGAAILTITGDNPGDGVQNPPQPTWTIDTKGKPFAHLVITLKQAGGPSGGFAAFLIDQTVNKLTAPPITGFEGLWNTAGPGNSKNGLSHASLYYQPIPLPLGVWLALTAVGGFVMLRRREAAFAA